MPSLTIENYVKTIYQICSRHKKPAATGQLAEELDVLPGTVTSMLKTLSEAGLAEYRPYEGVQLTDAGRSLALRVLRRHRLIEQFLVKTLALTWDEVHEEAENMEHAVSDLLVDRIDEYLGFPESDPHGDPIPRSDGTVSVPEGKTLPELEAGQRFQLVRVMDQAPEFLRYLSDVGMPLGVVGTVVDQQSQAGVVTIEIEGADMTLSREKAEKLLVAEPVDVA